MTETGGPFPARNGGQGPEAGNRPNRNNGKPSWRIRRAIIFATLTYCAVLGIWAVMQGPDLARAVLAPVFGLAGGIIAAYVFGAAAEDVLINRGRHER